MRVHEYTGSHTKLAADNFGGLATLGIEEALLVEVTPDGLLLCCGVRGIERYVVVLHYFFVLLIDKLIIISINYFDIKS